MASDSSSQPMETPTRAGHGQSERSIETDELLNRNLRKSQISSVRPHAVTPHHHARTTRAVAGAHRGVRFGPIAVGVAAPW